MVAYVCYVDFGLFLLVSHYNEAAFGLKGKKAPYRGAYRVQLFIGFLPKTGVPGQFCAKKRYILKPSTNHTPGAVRLASLTS